MILRFELIFYVIVCWKWSDEWSRDKQTQVQDFQTKRGYWQSLEVHNKYWLVELNPLIVSEISTRSLEEHSLSRILFKWLQTPARRRWRCSICNPYTYDFNPTPNGFLLAYFSLADKWNPDLFRRKCVPCLDPSLLLDHPLPLTSAPDSRTRVSKSCEVTMELLRAVLLLVRHFVQLLLPQWNLCAASAWSCESTKSGCRLCNRRFHSRRKRSVWNGKVW